MSFLSNLLGKRLPDDEGTSADKAQTPAGPPPAFHLEGVDALSARQALELITAHKGNPGLVLLDVRTPPEVAQGRIDGCLLHDCYGAGFASALAALPVGPAYIVACHSGARSGNTCRTLRKLGHKDVYNLTGGMAAWAAQGLPMVRG
jgi:rhodanese-related sulfurtransferase